MKKAILIGLVMVLCIGLVDALDVDDVDLLYYGKMDMASGDAIDSSTATDSFTMQYRSAATAGAYQASPIPTHSTYSYSGNSCENQCAGFYNESLLNALGGTTNMCNFTVSLWIDNTRDGSGSNFITASQDPIVDPAWAIFHDGANMRFRHDNGASPAYADFATPTYFNGMVTAVANITGIYMYINGTFQDYTAISSCDVSDKNADFVSIIFYNTGGPSVEGEVDEVVIVNRSLTTPEILDLYTNGVGAGTPPSAGVVVTLISPIDNTNNNTPNNYFYFNVTNASTCNLYTNDTSWSVKDTVSATANITESMNYTFTSEGDYVWNVDCGDYGFASANRTLTIDTTNPITSAGFSSNGVFTVWGNNLTGQINASDLHLYSIRVNLTPVGQVYSLTGITSTTYVLNFSFNVSNGSWGLGKHNVTIKIADAHTNQTISEYDNLKNPLTKAITYSFDNDYISITPTNNDMFHDLTHQKLTDRYIFKYYPGLLGTTELNFRVRSSRKIDIVNRDDYKGWLVVEDLNKWIDFELTKKTGKEIYTVTVISDNIIDIKIQNVARDAEYVFESIGDLNIVTETYQWYLINATETYSKNLLENTTTSYVLNISKNGGISTSASFSYNSTLYSLTKSSGAEYDLYTASVTHIVPNSFNLSVPINWSYNVTSNSTSGNYSIDRTDVIHQMILGTCNANVSFVALNYSVTNIDAGVFIDDYDFEGNYNIWSSANTNHIKSYGFDIAGLNQSNKLCIYPQLGYFNTNYEARFTHTSYEDTNYVVGGGYLNGTEQLINIYMQNSTGTTDITITVADEFDDELVGYTVKAYQYQFVNDSYTLVNTKVTDSNGKVIMGLAVSGKEYRFNIENPSGVEVHVEPKQILTDTSYTFRVYLGSIPEIIQQEVYDLDITLTADRVSNQFNLTWNEISYAASSIKLDIVKTNGTYDNLISSVSSTSNTGVLGYTITEPVTNLSATFIAKVYVVSTEDGETYFVVSETLDYKKEWDVFEEESLLATFMFVGTMMFIGITISPIAALILTSFGMLVFWYLGMYATSLSGLLSMIVVLIIGMVRQRR